MKLVISSELTHRDKVLLYVLAIVVALFLFLKLGINPQMDRADKLDEQIIQLEEQKLPMEAAILSLSKLGDISTKAEEGYAEATDSFFEYMENYEVDKLLTTLVTEEHNLSMTSLEMGTAEALLTPYYLGLTEETVDYSKSYIPILTLGTGIKAKGNRKDIEKLIDDIFVSYPSIRITSYRIDDSAGKGESSLNLSADVYMLNK
ncbi:MAG: hypothetical protein Q4C42_02350 [Clostridia bacterium]|nr:hypothetical protein [Clostridia bacterium]